MGVLDYFSSQRRSLMLWIYAGTILTSSFLLFLVQPLFARMVLPLLGGSPSVWNTCMVFYQAALLAGYAYAHFATTWLGAKRQSIFHLVLMLSPFVVLPLAVPPGLRIPTDSDPTFWLLGLLAVAVGLPFFVVSASNPMIQRWFSRTDHPAAADPYFLYAASNFGSMVALLSYPFLVEPFFDLRTQSIIWTVGYALLYVLTAICAFLLWNNVKSGAKEVKVDAEIEPILTQNELSEQGTMPREGVVDWGRRLRWVALSAVPSSLMLGVTTYLTTDIASFPMLWVIPLSLYLLTFILVFASHRWIPHRWMLWLFPWMIAFEIVGQALELPLLLRILSVLVVVFVASMVCHGELAEDRPHPRYLTEFYLWMSLGGVIGGIFNALCAPVLFTSILEFPIGLIAACLLLPTVSTKRWSWRDLTLPAAVAIAFLLVVWPMFRAGTETGRYVTGVSLVLGAVLFLVSSNRPLVMASIAAAIFLTRNVGGDVLYAERSFFGVHRVTVDREANKHTLEHGTTIHGAEYRDASRLGQPTAYYDDESPFTDILKAYQPVFAKMKVGIVGLGTGSLASYARPDDQFTYFEIDPAVREIAENPAYFSFLQGKSRDQYRIVMGDARLQMADEPDGVFDVIVIDAFSSDSIPVHLLTKEAIDLYLKKLNPHGVIFFHISNRNLRLVPVLERLSHAMGLVGMTRLRQATRDQLQQGSRSVQAFVIARRAEDLTPLLRYSERYPEKSRWQNPPENPGGDVWTDSFSNIVRAIRW